MYRNRDSHLASSPGSLALTMEPDQESREKGDGLRAVSQVTRKGRGRQTAVGVSKGRKQVLGVGLRVTGVWGGEVDQEPTSEEDPEGKTVGVEEGAEHRERGRKK